ncbi:uncharacterized protein LOC134680112 [Cydia fagiglandana]|uniref:uncharacterized protein LOC134680112 n=1 Tax=Cydia fagiglandana TaxID=1458189 RepID=UPI002FEE491B
MTIGKRAVTVLAAITIIAVAVPCFTAQPPSADESPAKDRTIRQAVQARKRVAQTPKWGFFGTIFHVILEQVNDTKSAYNQISDLVNGQFTDDQPGVTAAPAPDPADNGTTPTPKISRAEFLKILERNLKGLQRLRQLEWREAKKDSMANIQRYKEEIFGGKKPRKR